MADFLAELKRRHIYRVGAAYVVVAWALTQLVEILAQVFTLPLWMAQTAIVLLAIGFPVALFVAWTIESRPHEAVAAAVRSKPTIVDWSLCGALALVILLIGYQQIAPSSSPTRQAGVDAAKEAAASPATAVSVAVLPFSNLSGDSGQEFFSDGVTEEITAALARVPDLRVVARTSAYEFKGQNRNVQTIGQQLQATHLIEGSVRKAGDRVRITAQLINTANGIHVWSENYDRQLTDIFAIQEDIARAIASSLRMSLGIGAGEQLISNRGIDPVSYEQFLRGRAALGRARNAFAEQLALLEPVAEKNPDYAPAWAALARAYRFAAQLSSAKLADRAAYRSKSIAAAARALELDPNLVSAQVEHGRALSFDRQWVAAADVLSKALTLDPNDPDALEAYSGLLLGVGRLEDGLSIKQKLHVLEPYVPVYNGNLATALWLNNQNEASISVWMENFGREGAGAAIGLSETYASLERYEEAADILSQMQTVERYRPYSEIITGAVQLLRSAPTKVAAPEKLPRLAELSFVYLYVGAPERVFDFQEESPRGFMEIASLWHPSYKPVRSTERFKRLMRSVGLVDYWRERGWPEFCKPVGADDFACE